MRYTLGELRTFLAEQKLGIIERDHVTKQAGSFADKNSTFGEDCLPKIFPDEQVRELFKVHAATAAHTRCPANTE